jgi:hypothetical protein
LSHRSTTARSAAGDGIRKAGYSGSPMEPHPARNASAEAQRMKRPRCFTEPRA